MKSPNSPLEGNKVKLSVEVEETEVEQAIEKRSPSSPGSSGYPL